MGNILTKRQIVLRRVDSTNLYVAVDDEDAPWPERTHSFYVESVAVEDMGEPDTITVTIEPGDRLNDEG